MKIVGSQRTIFGILLTWRNAATKNPEFEHLQRLYKVLTHRWESDELVFYILNRVRGLCADYLDVPRSAILRHFQSKVRSFYWLVTGDTGQGLASPATSTKLRDTTLYRQQQWAPIYKIISDLRADVTKKQQIITCLGFRNVLEMLPAQPEVLKHFTNPTPHGTGKWPGNLSWRGNSSCSCMSTYNSLPHLVPFYLQVYLFLLLRPYR